MDQEGGRRRSTRLAAKGSSPKVETPVKRAVKKSAEKPKRAKRKQTEEVIDLPESKKSKSVDNSSSDETDKPEENITNDIKKVDEPDVPSLNKDYKEENESPTIEKNDDESISDSKKESEPILVANEKEDEEANEEKQIEEQIPEVAEQLQIDEPQEISEPVSVEKNANDSVTPNGDADAQINTANGDKEEPIPESVEPIKVLHDNTNHVAENDLKTVTLPVSINTTPNNVVLDVKQDEKEQDEVVDSEINIIVSPNDNAPNMDQPSTIVS